ncbi:MAG: PilZ domain-containing protein [Candidatus Acidiferrales bacterium]
MAFEMPSAPATMTRQFRRSSYLRDLSVLYEGGQAISLHAPDISPQGMIINTSDELPEGAVLKVSFRLPRSDFEVNVRCEVRYYLPGIGVGVEFVDISAEAREAIEQETSTAGDAPASGS